MMPLKSEDRSENKEENYTKGLLLVLPEGSYFAGRILIFFMLPSQDETQTCTDNFRGNFTTSNTMRNNLQGSTHVGTRSGFPQRAAATPGTSLQKYFSDISGPQVIASAASDGSYLRTT